MLKRSRAKYWSRIFVVGALQLQSAAVATDSTPTEPAPPLRSQYFWVGDYGTDANSFTIGEREHQLFVVTQSKDECALPRGALQVMCGSARVELKKGAAGRAQLLADGVPLERRTYGVDASNVSHITPVRPVDELRREALAASPPDEKGPFRKSELVELAPLDPAIHLDIRYATTNDFLGTPVYTQARAFMQRPAAEALLHALAKLKARGYGLLIHDAYRPWYVTKIFWDATPPEGKIFVADPAQGSRHNRGCAVDLTLYDLKSGKPVDMPGTYDEMSDRSFPGYPGGTSRQRWHRELLRSTMESEGFSVYDSEWWHFDYKDWREYAIGNVPFEQIHAAGF
jgi:D-alanyl-D-alanine dipeptidase